MSNVLTTRLSSKSGGQGSTASSLAVRVTGQARLGSVPRYCSSTSLNPSLSESLSAGGEGEDVGVGSGGGDEADPKTQLSPVPEGIQLKSLEKISRSSLTPPSRPISFTL